MTTETTIIALDGVSNTPVKRFVRNKDVPITKYIIRERMVSARIMNGMTAVEAAERLGYKNSTQISQIESGERKVPNDWQFLFNMSKLYAVSIDYLIGVSPNPERDAIASEHFSIMRSFEELQRKQAATMTTAFVRHAMMGGPAIRELASLCAGIEAIHAAVTTMRERCPEFDDLRGGATVLSSLDKLVSAVNPIKGILKRRKENEQYMIDIASGKQGPISYLMDGQPGLDLEG